MCAARKCDFRLCGHQVRAPLCRTQIRLFLKYCDQEGQWSPGAGPERSDQNGGDLTTAGKRPLKESHVDLCLPESMDDLSMISDAIAVLYLTPQVSLGLFSEGITSQTGIHTGPAYHPAVTGLWSLLVCLCNSPSPSPGRIPLSAACIISKVSSLHLLNFVQSTGLSPMAIIACPHQHWQGQ